MKLFLASAVVLSLWIALAQVRERHDPMAIALDGSKTLYIVQRCGWRIFSPRVS
jgi:hypothetical protein